MVINFIATYYDYFVVVFIAFTLYEFVLRRIHYSKERRKLYWEDKEKQYDMLKQKVIEWQKNICHNCYGYLGDKDIEELLYCGYYGDYYKKCLFCFASLGDLSEEEERYIGIKGE